MLPGSLKERLAQLKSLKEEEKREEEKKAAALPEVSPAQAEEKPAEAGKNDQEQRWNFPYYNGDAPHR